jgi:AraC family transcriptional activator of pobA
MFTLDRFYYIHHTKALSGAMHTHKLHEYVYCIKGEGHIVINGEKYSFCTGTIYVTEAGTPHLEVDYSESKIIYFYFDCNETELVSGVFKDRNGAVLPILRKLQSEVRGEQLKSDKMKRALLTQLFIETERCREQRRVDQNFLSVLEYIDENFRYDVDLRKLAQNIGYSYERFRHIFKEQTGYSPCDYINSKRIDMAKMLIENEPELSMTYVAYECGFPSSSHFSNAFKKKMGETPFAYKKRQK